MQWHLFFFLLGRIAILNGLAFFVPLLASVWWGERGYVYFGPSIFITLGVGAAFIFFGRKHNKYLGVAGGAWYMVLVWVLLGIIGMLPYVLSGALAAADAFFESVSAFTTVGLSCLDYSGGELPRSLVLWHSMMAWMGGLNFILLMVTIIPQVGGCFGLTLSVQQSISFSPMVGRMQTAARQVGNIYVAVTVISVLAYLAAGLPLADACISAFLSVSTSGANMHDPGLGGLGAEMACAFSMLLASGNFLLYWKSFQRRQIKAAFHDTELKVFLLALAGTGLLVSLHLWLKGAYGWFESLRFGLFHVLSFYSTSGYMTTDVSAWPDFDKLVLFLVAFAGGCIGSATGGLRIMRFIVLFKIAAQEMRHLLHPRMVISLKISGVPVDMKIISRVLSYFFLFMAVFFVSTILISLSGMTPLQSMGVAAGCLTSSGATAHLFGVVDFAAEPVWLKAYCAFLMILGRLEIFSFLIVLQTAAQAFKRRW